MADAYEQIPPQRCDGYSANARDIMDEVADGLRESAIEHLGDLIVKGAEAEQKKFVAKDQEITEDAEHGGLVGEIRDYLQEGRNPVADRAEGYLANQASLARLKTMADDPQTMQCLKRRAAQYNARALGRLLPPIAAAGYNSLNDEVWRGMRRKNEHQESLNPPQPE